MENTNEQVAATNVSTSSLDIVLSQLKTHNKTFSNGDTIKHRFAGLFGTDKSAEDIYATTIRYEFFKTKRDDMKDIELALLEWIWDTIQNNINFLEDGIVVAIDNICYKKDNQYRNIPTTPDQKEKVIAIIKELGYDVEYTNHVKTGFAVLGAGHILKIRLPQIDQVTQVTTVEAA